MSIHERGCCAVTSRARGAFLLATASALLLLAASGSVARADVGFGQVGQFGSAGSGAGEFEQPLGIAVAQTTGNVYVTDLGNNRVDTFTSSGAFVNAFGGDVGGPGVNVCTTACGKGTSGSGNGQFSSPTGVAVDPSGNVYVVDSGNNRLEEFSSSGGYLSQITATDPSCTQAFSNPTGVAIAPVPGALYVADFGNNRVVKIDPATGVCDSAFDGSIAASGTFSSPRGVAVDSAGTIYVLDSGNARVEKFDSTGALLSALDNGGSPMALAVDATSKAVYIADSSGTSGIHILDYDSTGALLGTFGVNKFSDLGGLAVNHALTEIFATNLFLPASVLIFGQATWPHTVTGAASEVTTSSATVGGTVNPEGTETSYSFQYGLDTTYRAGSSPSMPAGSGTSAVEASAKLAELQPNITYHYRLVGTNAAGSTFGADKTLTTEPEAPKILGESSSGVTPFAARLEAQINPNNQATTYKFQYSTSPTLETPTEVSGESALSGFTAEGQLVGVQAGGLTPGTVYYYRVIAVNATGPNEPSAAIQSLETLPPPPSATTGGVSAVSRTAATLTGTVNPEGGGPGSTTTWCFEYAKEEEKKYALGIVGIPGEAGPGTENVEVTAALTGLEPNVTYHYRLLAVNNVNSPTGTSRACNTFGGYETDGEDKSFTTVALAPIVTTDEVAAVGSTSATLDGSIVPQGVDARYHFEYGPTASYGAIVPLPAGDGGSGTTGQFVTEAIGGLTPNTTYHYRLVATTSGGTTYGWDQAFFTTSETPTVQTAPSFGAGAAPGSLQTATFPDLSALAPEPPAKVTTEAPKPLTRAQRLARALKQCRKAKSKPKRVACEKTARKNYGTKATKKK